MSSELSPTGRTLLDRRGFLGRSLGGLSGIALAHLLGSESLLRGATGAAVSTGFGGKGPIRPVIRAEAPYAARAEL
jgi:hypothetical protein